MAGTLRPAGGCWCQACCPGAARALRRWLGTWGCRQREECTARPPCGTARPPQAARPPLHSSERGAQPTAAPSCRRRAPAFILTRPPAPVCCASPGGARAQRQPHERGTQAAAPRPLPVAAVPTHGRRARGRRAPSHRVGAGAGAGPCPWPLAAAPAGMQPVLPLPGAGVRQCHQPRQRWQVQEAPAGAGPSRLLLARGVNTFCRAPRLG